MTGRERLIELIEGSKIFERCGCHYNDVEKYIKELTDYLLCNGVFNPPCKIGDTIWLMLELLQGGQELVESRCVKITIISDRQIVYSMYINDRAIGNTLEFYDDDFDKTVFLSREEALKALKECKENA